MLTSMYGIIIVGSSLLIISALTSIIAFRFGAPLLLVFLSIGLLAGEDGIGGIQFDDAESVYFFGSIALAIILYDSGFNTKLQSLRLSAGPSLLLATAGVVITASIVGLAAHFVFGFSLLEGMLLGSIIGSTDAAAVFFLLRVGGVTIRDRVRSTLEVESSSNDPIAILLTTVFVELLARPDTPSGLLAFAITAFQQAGLGLAFGVLGGFVIIQVVTRLNLEAGLYPLITLGLAVLCFGITGMVGGSGFVAVFVAGVIAGNAKFSGIISLRKFQDSLTWVFQIAMFLLLGLLASPSQFPDAIVQGIVVAAVLTFIARPIAVWVCLLPFNYRPQDTAFISWVGLRGAVSVLLAVLPITGGLPSSQLYFNITFIAVLVSLLLQGWTIRPVARWLGQIVPPKTGPLEKIELELPGGTSHELVSYRIVPDSPIATGARLPRWARPSLILRDGASLRLHDAGRLQTGDHIYIFTPPRLVPMLDRLFASAATSVDEDDPTLFGQFQLDPTQPLERLADMYGVRSKVGSELTIAEYMEDRLSGPPEPGDRVDFGSMDLIVRDIDGSGRIKAVGLYLGPEYEPVDNQPFFIRWLEALHSFRSKK